MLSLMPCGTQTPNLATVLQDIGNPTAAEVGEALGVSERTARRWIADDCAPRPALLALFWVSRWGRSLVDAELFNAAMISRQMAESLRRENDHLRQLVGRLGDIGDFGSANDPAPEVSASTPPSRPTAEPVKPQTAPAPRRVHLPGGLTPDESARLLDRMNSRKAKQRLHRLKAGSTQKAA